MRVLSVNISPSKEIDFHGQKVRTSIFKLPVEGRRRVGKLTIEGDTQSDLLAHGGEHRAILVYQKDSYDYWKATLRRDDLHYGQFGENFTVEGLADHEVCIGDRFQIGTAIFEVTQPRVTCFKVGISLGVPEMPALLVAHKRPGFYFRVIQEGEVGAGDAIIKLSTGAGAMSVVTIDALLYSNVHPKDRLWQALQIEALSEGWKGSFRALYEGNSGLAPAGSVAAWPGHLPSGPAGEGPLVSFARSRIAFKWHPRFRSLLEAAEACDVPVMWSCRSGVCHRCETALFAGSVDYFVPPMEEPVEGNVLICCSAPRTDVELDL